MRLLETIKRLVPFRQDQTKAGVAWAMPNAAAKPMPAIQTETLASLPVTPGAMPVASPLVAQAVPQAAASPMSAVAEAAVPASTQQLLASLTPPAATPPPAPEEAKKLPDNVLNIFMEEAGEKSSLQSLASSFPEVDVHALYQECLETKNKLCRRS